MELKQSYTDVIVLLPARFNRTFMELKQIYTIRDPQKHKCFNRTFMELKLEELGGIVADFVF